MAVEEQLTREDAAFARPSHHGRGAGGGDEGFPPAGGTPPRSGSPPDGGGSRGAADDELTSLTWLQDTNLLRKLPGSSGGGGGGTTRGVKAVAEEEEESGEWGAEQVPYNPQVHVTAKPPYSFSCLIFMAIEESPDKALPVKDIYAWILARFPYFQSAPTGWKNSVRHNLSLNKCFRKVDREKGVGKGSLWCIDPEYRPALVQAVRRAPAFPQGQWVAQTSSPRVVPSSHSSSEPQSDPSQPNNTNVPSPSLFPFLSKRLAASSTKDQDVDAAAAMLALQNGPSLLPLRSDNKEDVVRESSPSPKAIKKERSRPRTERAATASPSKAAFQTRKQPYRNSASSPSSSNNHHHSGAATPVITSSPSEDHTYSASLSNGSANTNDDSDAEHIVIRYGVVERSPSPPPPAKPVVPPRKRRLAAPPPRKLRRGPPKRPSTARERPCSAEDEMAEGAHALLNLAKIATSQQQMLLLEGTSR